MLRMLLVPMQMVSGNSIIIFAYIFNSYCIQRRPEALRAMVNDSLQYIICAYTHPFSSLVIDGANPNVAAAAGVSPNGKWYIYNHILLYSVMFYVPQVTNVLVSNPAAASGITYGVFLYLFFVLAFTHAAVANVFVRTRVALSNC